MCISLNVMRLPFDPSKVEIPAEEKAAKPALRDRVGGKTHATLADAHQLTVSQLSELIKSTLEQRIPSPLRVIGQVSNLRDSGHWYFSLKDESAVVNCVAWASSAKKFGFTPRDGDEVVATGHVSHFGPQGRTQLYVTKLDPVGAGALELEFRRMCEELRGLGYFDPGHKVPLPAFPRKVAVITSKDGAALQDVIATAKQRCTAVGLLVVDVRVQGEGAPEQVARAIKWVDGNSEKLGVDAILVTRGGGSIEDLWAFNTRIVADAAFKCKLPLVAAIGHESDVTVIELVADVRAATPTQAAMRLVPASTECNKQIEHLQHRLTVVTKRLIDRGKHRLESLERHETFRRPEVIIQRAAERIESISKNLSAAMRHVHAAARLRLEQICSRLAQIGPGTIVYKQEQRLAILEDRLNRAARHRIDQRPRILQLHRALIAAQRHVLRQSQFRIEANQARLAAVDPLKVLERGYSVTYDADGNVVRSWRSVAEGDRIRNLLADGAVESVVEGGDSKGLAKEKIAKPQAAPGKIVKKSSERKRQGRSQMDLF